MSLVYLLASLPMLEFSVAPRVTMEGFLQVCREQLSASDARLTAALALGQPVNHSFAKAWQAHETLLRNAIARERGHKLGQKDVERWLRPTGDFDTSLTAAAANAFQRENPLERERSLDKLRWEAAERLAGLDPLSLNALLAYALKLSIATRWTQLDSHSGRAAFEERAQAPADLLAAHSEITNDDTE